MLKIAHISDLHLSRKYKPGNFDRTIRLIEYALSLGANHLVITGDLTHNVPGDDLADLRGILDRFGLLDTSKTSLVIGNHDIFGGVHLAEDVLDFPGKCANTDYHQRIRDFKYIFYELFEDVYTPVSGSTFPFVKSLNGVSLIGLNSIAPYFRFKNAFASRGKVDKLQLDGIKQIFRKKEFQDQPKLVLIHHHFFQNAASGRKNKLLSAFENWTMILEDRQRLFSLFKNNNVKAVLHGHVHTSVVYQKDHIYFSNAGGSLESKFRDALKLNLLIISENHTQVTVQTIYPRASNKIFYPAVPISV